MEITETSEQARDKIEGIAEEILKLLASSAFTFQMAELTLEEVKAKLGDVTITLC